MLFILENVCNLDNNSSFKLKGWVVVVIIWTLNCLFVNHQRIPYHWHVLKYFQLHSNILGYV